MDIVNMYDATMSGSYVFELKKTTSLRSAVIFARQRLLQAAAAMGYNVFVTEGCARQLSLIVPTWLTHVLQQVESDSPPEGQTAAR